jgi:hypothetical protein
MRYGNQANLKAAGKIVRCLLLKTCMQLFMSITILASSSNPFPSALICFGIILQVNRIVTTSDRNTLMKWN